MKQPAKGLLITGIVLVVLTSIVAIFRYMNPGIYIPYKCDQGGDSTRKFYDPNWQARGAVCDGYYIPVGTKLNGKNAKDILAKMPGLSNNIVPATSATMKTLAEQAAA